MRIAVDLDGVLRTETRRYDKILGKPVQEEIDAVNRLYDENNTIFIFTACSWEEYHVTKAWLKMYKVKYHELIMGKPNYDIIIDDRSRKTVKEVDDELSDRHMLDVQGQHELARNGDKASKQVLRANVQPAKRKRG